MFVQIMTVILRSNKEFASLIPDYGRTLVIHYFQVLSEILTDKRH